MGNGLSVSERSALVHGVDGSVGRIRAISSVEFAAQHHIVHISVTAAVTSVCEYVIPGTQQIMAVSYSIA